MFGKSKPQSTIDSLIGVTTVIEGDVVFSGGLRIDGQVKGNVVAAGEADGTNSTLVVSESARIQGEIRAAHVVVNGAVDGPLFVTEFLELQPKARVNGDVHYKSIEIHLGATLDGKLEHLRVGQCVVRGRHRVDELTGEEQHLLPCVLLEVGRFHRLHQRIGSEQVRLLDVVEQWIVFPFGRIEAAIALLGSHDRLGARFPRP